MKRQLILSSIGVAMASVLLAANALDVPESLTAARTVWSKAAPASYSYRVHEHTTTITVCIGPDSKQFQGMDTTITVQNGRITRMTSDAFSPRGKGRGARVSLVRNVEIPESCLKSLWIYKQYLHTIDGLFSFIEREQANHQGIPNPKIKYDVTFGFPTFVNERSVLDGSSYSISDFRILK